MNDYSDSHLSEKMFKENVHVLGEGITNQQRSRISQNFRAAKPLLDHKRPRQTMDFHHHFPHKTRDAFEIESPGEVTSIKRVALTEIPINTPSPHSLKGGYSSISCAKYRSVRKTELINDVQNARASVVPMDSECLSDLFITPVKQLESSNSSESFFMPSLLDDDFDESILQEIDAICEKSASKVEKDCQNSSSYYENQHNDNSSNDFKSGSESVTTNENKRMDVLLEAGDDMKSRAEETNTSRIIENGSMPDEYSKYLQSLNDRQHEAACCEVSTPLMIVAGPGSGKTSTMVGRVLFLLNEGISPSNILAMTFTTAAASEMRDRIGSVAGKATAKEITISTFHSFSLQLCRSHAEKLQRTSEFLIYGHGQQRRAIIEAVRLLENEKSIPDHDACKLGEGSNGMECPQYYKDRSKKWQKFVTQAKASGKTPAECRKMGDEIGAAIIENYNDILRSCNALDYHDLISYSVKLLNNFPEVLKECQGSWKAIIIDEFQDTSAMQYCLLRILASHNHITIVGDDDQSIFSFNGADISGFDSFREDFPGYKEIRLTRNYRSTGCIVEAASSLIKHNMKRCQLKNVLTENSYGSKIIVKECNNEEAQCAFVVDKSWKVLLMVQLINVPMAVSGKVFQTAFRERRIPFNIHGVAFYRKKVVRAIIAMLRTTLPGCDDGPYRQVFKALLPLEKEEKKRIIDHIDKICTIRKSSFISAACDIFSAKISGTFKRSQLTQGRKVLSTIEMILKLVQREQSISAVITSVANIIPQRYLLEHRAVVDFDGGKLLNEDNDLRSVLQYLLDDVSNFLSTKCTATEETKVDEDKKGCVNIIKAFIDYISERERENFRTRRHENGNSVTLTTIHQSKGLEWDIVFIVKANESEIPLLHDFNGVASEKGTLIEEERRLLYVAMTRARKRLFILYVTMDSSWQLLRPSRFLKELPHHLLEVQIPGNIIDARRSMKFMSIRVLVIFPKRVDKLLLGILAELCVKDQQTNGQGIEKETSCFTIDLPRGDQPSETDLLENDFLKVQNNEATKDSMETVEACDGNSFLRRFSVDDRSIVAHLFRQWAKKQAFQDPKRLLNKAIIYASSFCIISLSDNIDVPQTLATCLYLTRPEVSFVIDERLRVEKNKHKDVLRALKSCLGCGEAHDYAEYVLRWEQIPADKRAHLMREKQEHFQKLRIENSMGSAAPTSKQIAFLRTLGCTADPTSRLHASRLIEQYKSL
ncbi:hypothetical protein JRO89_XS01G0384400 [Xanthoceras sorbifolium]|uniref:DNA 3'-5' helicase n=1 Tax=Xanthoceras sorbifolium TaxID=99658 RepID=A0ABQ8IP27_9ROSI|nr:hypothetical protein JRO89_XS01G0384400 [Xanthoceras sorbifolium]